MQNYSSPHQLGSQGTPQGSGSPTKHTTTTIDYSSPGKYGQTTTTTTTTTSYLDSKSYLPSGYTTTPGFTTSQTGTDYANQTSYLSPGLKTSISSSVLGSGGRSSYLDQKAPYDIGSTTSSVSRDYTSYPTGNRPDYQGLPQTEATSRISLDSSPSRTSGLYTSGLTTSYSTSAIRKSPDSSPTTSRFSTAQILGNPILSDSFIRLQSANSPQALSTLNLGKTTDHAEGTPTYYPGSSIYNKKSSPEMSPKYHHLQKDILDRVQRAKDTVDKTLSNSKTQSPLRTSQQLGTEFSSRVEEVESPSRRPLNEEERVKRAAPSAYNSSNIDKILADIKSPTSPEKSQGLLSATIDVTQVQSLKDENNSLREQVARLTQEHETEKVKRSSLPTEQTQETQTKLRELESQVQSFATEKEGLQREIEQLRNRSTEAEQKHNESTSSYTRLETQLHDLQKENETLKGRTAEIDQLHQEVNTHKTSVADRERQVKEQTSELEKLQTQVAQLNEARGLIGEGDFLSGIRNLVQTNTSLKGELDQHQNLKSQSLESSQTLENRVRDLEQAKASADQEVNRLNTLLQEANSQLSNSKEDSESRAKQLQDEQSNLQHQINVLLQASSASSVQQTEGINNADLKNILEQITQTKSELKQLRDSENAKIQEISQLTKANQTLTEEIQTSKSQSTEVRAAEEQRNQRIHELETQVANLEAEKSSNQSRITELSNSIKNLESNSDENTKNLIHQVQTLTEEKASLDGKISSLQSEHQHTAQELATIKNSSHSQQGKFNEDKVLLQKQVTQVEEQLQQVQKESLDTKTTLQNTINQLKSEKQELERQFYENQDLASKSQGDLTDILSNLKSTKDAADREKKIYEQEIAASQTQIENLKQEVAQLKATHEKESKSFKEGKSSLEEELKKSRERETSSQTTSQGETKKLQETLKQVQDENKKLKEEIRTYTSQKQKQTQESSQSHSQELKKKEQLIKDLESKITKITSEREQDQKKLTSLETESKSKDKQIEGLKHDISQMKGFIYQHHNESLFDQNENAEEQKSDKASDIKFTVPSETSFTQDLLGSFIGGSEWETGSIKRSQPKPKAQAKAQGKGSRSDINDSVRGTEYVITQVATKTQPATIKTKKQREQDPVHARYEKMIKDLNEKIVNIDKTRKKDAEIQILESSKQYIQREEKLSAEIEALKQQNIALAKKIEDIEWNKAYEYTEKLKKEGPPQNQPTGKTEPAHAVPADGEAKKKKKKKKKNKTNEKSKDESDAE